MSSGEEADSACVGSEGSGASALSTHSALRRGRQRVDAGEPRNSYCLVGAPAQLAPRSLMSGGLYGAVFEGRPHFGLFGPGYAPAKMLNELLGRPPKEEHDDQGGDLAQHVLRDILHGRKKELMQLERELRMSSPASDNNNVLANNNNDEPKEKCEEDSMRGTGTGLCREDKAQDLDDALLALKSGVGSENAVAAGSPSPRSCASGDTLVKTEPAPESPSEPGPRSPSRAPLNAKRARVENIVSTMRSSPVPQQPQVNGCKKRKLYQPQQHDGAADRYGNISLGMQSTTTDDSDDEDRPPIQQKIVEKNALKSQLRSMQEQLAEMQQKYVQLCNRMEQESVTIDNDASSDVEQLDDSPDKSEPASPTKETPPVMPNTSTPNMLSQMMMSKMISAKIHGQHPHGLAASFNGALPLLPPLAPHDHPLHHQHAHPHAHNVNTAAMYLNQKLFMEQEARMAKEAAEQQSFNNSRQQTPSRQNSPQHRPHINATPKPQISSELAEKLEALRNNAGSVGPVSGADLEGLAEVLKSEIISSLGSLIDSILTRFVQQRRIIGKQSEAAAAAAEQLNKDLMLASRLLERKSPSTKLERPGQPAGNGPIHPPNGMSFMNSNPIVQLSQMNQMSQMNGPRANGTFPMHEGGGPGPGHSPHHPHARGPAAMFQTPKPPMFAALNGQFERDKPEQNEALSLVVTKKKRHKVTDTRITPRTVSRILGEGVGLSPEGKYPDSPSPRPYPGGLSLPTSVAIPNPSLHESQVFSPYSPFFGSGAGGGGGVGVGRSPPAPERDSPPLPHAPAMLHPALLAAVHSAPEYLRTHHPPPPPHLPHAPPHHLLDAQDPHSDCNSTELSFDGMQPTISFSIYQAEQVHSSTLTPMHLRKAKLMFFWVRYPSSAVLKMYFPDIKFNKNNTAQLVKWFSNFREFYYIQMEKYARQAISEGLKSADEIHVAGDCELYRVLNLHYNRNNHIEVPPNFRYVVEQTLREFFRAIQGGKDSEQSWKKSIYKVISRLDDPVPEYFKTPNFLEQLE